MAGRRSGNKQLPSLSRTEWAVMKTFWDNGPLAARDVYAKLPENHGWAVKTVKTMLTRLVAKGALDYEQVGNSYLYRAVFTRERMTRKEMKGFIDRVLDGSLAPVLAHFIEERELSENEIAALQKLLEQKSNGGRKGVKTKLER